MAFIMGAYLLSYVAMYILGDLIPGFKAVIYGFNFLFGVLMATILCAVVETLRKKNIIHRQYMNTFLMTRISGFFFDVMIVAGIAGINIDDLSGYWVPFILMAVLGAIVTYFYLIYMCKKLYPDYAYEGFFSMYGMLTGTISSGVLLLREIDPNFETPAANNLVTGSSFGIVFGAPVLLLVSYAPQDTWMTLLLIIVYLLALMLFIFKVGKKSTK